MTALQRISFLLGNLVLNIVFGQNASWDEKTDVLNITKGTLHEIVAQSPAFIMFYEKG